MERAGELARTRNFGIIAHIDAGKTTLSERILFYTGRTHQLGEVQHGNTVMDWMVQEQERGITITSAATTCEWDGHRLNLIDTPGHVDFTAEVERSLRVLDGAVGVFCGVGGVEPQSETVWRQASCYRVPRLAFINKLDRAGADHERCLAAMEKKLAAFPLLLQLPYGREENFRGVLELIPRRLLTWRDEDLGREAQVGEIPADRRAAVETARRRLLERLAEKDDEFLERWLEAEAEISEEAIHQALRRVTLRAAATPVLLGSAFKNRGVQPVLDGIVRYLPSPSELPPVTGTEPTTGAPLTRRPDDSEPFTALAFKIVSDQHVERLTWLRVYAGTVKSGKTVLNARTGRKTRLQRLFRMHADKREEREGTATGEIVAAVGPDQVITGDTLCDRERPIALERITFPEPVVSVAIEPRSQEQRDKLAQALARLAVEDPTFRVRIDDETGQTVIAGMGELHLEIIIDRLKREFKVEANVGNPQVAYQETLTAAVETDAVYERELGGHGHYARVRLRVEPKPGGGFAWENRAPAGELPAAFTAAVEEGVRGALGAGPLAGYPVSDLAVTLLGGAMRVTDSSAPDFAIAGAQALRQALRDGAPTLLEPVMKVTVTLPGEFLGAVLASLNSRRGTVRDVRDLDGAQQVVAEVPLAAMFGYATESRSLTEGRAGFNMEFARFAPLPETLAKALVT